MIVEDTVIGKTRSMEIILSRDQRTTSHRVLDSAARSVASTISLLQWTSSRTAGDNVGEIAQRNSYGGDRTHLQCDYTSKLYDCLERHHLDFKLSINSTKVLSFLCLLSLLIRVESAPIMNFENTPPKWVNPCGYSITVDDDVEVARIEPYTLLKLIVRQTNRALSHANSFKEDFVTKCFRVDLDDMDSWSSYHYDWLPGPKDLKKEINENLTQTDLNSLELDKTLLDAYEYMQKFAVGFEQIARDEEEMPSEIAKPLRDTEFEIRSVLCEIQTAISELGLTQRADVSRDIMGPEIRNLINRDSTQQLIRNWVIYRDYINFLEYLTQVFTYFRDKVKPKS